MENKQPKTPFFGGDASDLGTVHQLDALTFDELVNSVLNIATVLNVTRDEYHSMPKARRQKIKRVPYIVPTSFGSSPSPRRMENVEKVSLLCIDMDTNASAYYKHPETLAEQLMPFSFALYETATSTPEDPRLRLIVHASNLEPNLYRDAVRTIAKRIGYAHLNKESFTANLPMYLPTIFKGEHEVEDHPLVWSETGGRAFTPTDIKDVDNGDVTSQPDITDATFDTTSSGDDLAYLRPTVENITIDDAAEALEYIDPDITYPEWLEVAAALRHQFPHEPQATEAYELFDAWSAKGEKYQDKDDTKAKWGSLRPNPKGRVPVTIRSVIMKATAEGWNSTKVKERCFDQVLRWITTEASSPTVLLNQAVGRIAATPLISDSEVDVLLQEIIRNAKSRFNLKVSLGTLRKDLQKLRAAASIERNAKAKQKIPPWCKGLCYMAKPNVFYRHTNQSFFSPEAIDHLYAKKLLPTEEQLREMGEDSMAARSRPLVRPRDYLLNLVQIPCVYDTLYDPTRPNDTFIREQGSLYVNTYVRNYPEPNEEEAEYAGEVFMEHLGNLIAEEEYRRILTDFLAFLVQRPGQKVHWAVLLQGAQGCGKTWLSECMRTVLGDGHVIPVDSDALRGQWNDWGYGHQLVSLEEVRVAGQNRYEIMNKLKPMLANKLISVNQRFRDTRTLPNHTNYLLFTNHHDALVLQDDDRRYFVLKSALQTKDQIERLGTDYFKKLFTMLETHAAGLRHFFENWVISEDFEPDGRAPKTLYLARLIEDTQNEVTSAVREILDDDLSPMVSKRLVSSRNINHFLELRGLANIHPPRLAASLRDLGFRCTIRCRLDDGERHTLWVPAESTMDDEAVIMFANALLKDPNPSCEEESLL